MSADTGNAPCENTTNAHYFNGLQANPFNFTTVRGVHATLWSRSRISRCSSPDSNSSSGVSVWVSLEPAPGNAYYNSDTAIMQVGIIQCWDVGDPSNLCDDGGENNVWLFYATGGCGGWTPTARQLGSFPADTGAIVLDIRRQTTGYFTLSATGDVHSASVDISPTDSSTACWASGTGDDLGGTWTCERADNGDACGALATAKIGFRDVRIQKSVGGLWFYPGQVISGTQYGYPMTDANCTSTLSEDHCDVISTDDIDMWTVN